ncbi:hypothetical protein [Hymenobacter daeguensis]
MTYTNHWLQFREAEDRFFTCRYDFMQNEEEIVKDLKMALTKVGDNETALRFLRDMKPSIEIILPLVSGIMDNAIDSSNLNAIGLARDVLNNYKHEPLAKSSIQISAASYLAANDEWNYLRIAELYKLLDYKEELVNFIAICQVNSNLEIQEIGDDFYRAQD